MGLVNFIIKSVIRHRLPRIEGFIRKPVDTQEAVFRQLIYKARDTEWGRQHGYQKINSISEYKERTPVKTYEQLKPWIDRMMKGGQNLLWPGRINWFAKSSGTTSDKSKFIPVSIEALKRCHFKGGRDLMALYYRNNPDAALFDGRGLIMGGSNQINQFSKNSYYGDISAVMMSNMPPIAGKIRTPDLATSLMDNWEEKIEVMARKTIKDNVTHLVGVPTWTMVLIKKIFEITGKKNLKDVWPNLELYIHGGVSFTPYAEQFNKLIASENMYYIETYNASEGFFAIQDTPDGDDLLLMLDYGIFYEFMPPEEVGKEHPRTLQLNEVEPGKNYALIISTNAGLWRYLIGDTIQFTSLIPYRIQVSGRVTHFINAFGEEVIVHNSDQAIAEASKQMNCPVREYTVAPIFLTGETKGGHEWVIEFERQPSNLTRFTEILDQSLQNINSDYEAKRYKDLALELPVVHAVKEGTFHNWLRKKGKLGGQHKVPRLSNDRKYVEEILRLEREDVQ